MNSPASVILTVNKNRTNASTSTSVNTYASKIRVPSINIAPEGEATRSTFEGTQNTQTKLDPIVCFNNTQGNPKKTGKNRMKIDNFKKLIIFVRFRLKSLGKNSYPGNSEKSY